MERSLSSLDVWFRANGLKVNASKTQLMVFGSRQNLRSAPPIEVRFRGETICPVRTARNLGVIFDPCLSWDDHIAHVVRKCFGMLIGLSHIRQHLPPGVIPTIVHGLVLSHVRYCIAVFGNTSDANHRQLQRVINFCARVVAGKRKFDHISDVLSGPDWLTSNSWQTTTRSPSPIVLCVGESQSLWSRYLVGMLCTVSKLPDVTASFTYPAFVQKPADASLLTVYLSCTIIFPSN